MLPQNLLTLFASFPPLSTVCLQALANCLQYKTVNKGELLERQHQVSQNIYFIEAGLFRSYYHVQNQEISSWFMKAGDVIISVQSFFTQTPSQENIQALEESIVFYISKNDYENLCFTYTEFHYLARKLTEQYYVKAEKRIFHLHQPDARTRYQYLQQHHPDILQRVPLKYIASYLNITTETLSRIRGSF